MATTIWKKKFSPEEVLSILCLSVLREKFPDKQDGEITAQYDEEGNAIVYVVDEETRPEFLS